MTQSEKTLSERDAVEVVGFMECDTCRAKPGTLRLCDGCLHNRELIDDLKAHLESSPTPPASAAPSTNYQSYQSDQDAFDAAFAASRPPLKSTPIVTSVVRPPFEIEGESDTPPVELSVSLENSAIDKLKSDAEAIPRQPRDPIKDALGCFHAIKHIAASLEQAKGFAETGHSELKAYHTATAVSSPALPPVDAVDLPDSPGFWERDDLKVTVWTTEMQNLAYAGCKRIDDDSKWCRDTGNVSLHLPRGGWRLVQRRFICDERDQASRREAELKARIAAAEQERAAALAEAERWHDMHDEAVNHDCQMHVERDAAVAAKNSAEAAMNEIHDFGCQVQVKLNAALTRAEQAEQRCVELERLAVGIDESTG